MNVLFVMRSTIYVRNFESTLRTLASRGHRVHVLAERHLPESNDLIARLCAEQDGITWSVPPQVPFSSWSWLGRDLRRAVDFLRYLGSEYADAPKLRARAEKGAPPFVLEWLEHPWLASPRGRRWLTRALRLADRAMPTNPDIDACVAAADPDLLLVTPLVEPGSPQAEYLRSARARGVRTGLCVYSWDNLTNKGLIHDPLDVVTVWNDAMRQEAITLHGVPAGRVVVTGAAAYDHWFTWKPSLDREAFCRLVGLRGDRPYLLYLCSSKFIAPDEVAFVRKWVTELRRLSPVLRDCGVLVRPHPQNTDQWDGVALELDEVVVWPRGGANPMSAASRAEYFDSIHHAAAVTGINTSAQIESAIVGRAVYTILAPEFAATQEGTLHFQHLRQTLLVAADFAEHAAHLEAAVTGGGDAERCRRFVESFVRPHGREVPATPALVDALERLGARGRARPDRGPWWGPVARLALRPIVRRRADSDRGRQERLAWQEKLRERRQAEVAHQRASRGDARRVAAEARDERKRADAARREAASRARAALEARACENYRRIRDWAVRLRPATGDRDGAGCPRLEALAPLWAATPEMIATLRSQAAPVGLSAPDEYLSRDTEPMQRLKRDVALLRKQAGSGLFVYEPPDLGGFGFAEQGQLFNRDTARFFSALVALEDGAVIQDFRSGAGRRVVWEIGGGWGGFAYQFRTLCPDVTYVISGPPLLLLVSATYLTTLFPDARCRFEEADGGRIEAGWDAADFVFVPESAVGALTLPRLDLTVDLGVLAALGEARAAFYVRRAYDLGSRFLYTLGGDDDARLAERIEPGFWAHPIPPRRDRKRLDEDGTPADPPDRHVVGWRRIVA